MGACADSINREATLLINNGAAVFKNSNNTSLNLPGIRYAPPAAPQWVVTLSGRCSVETADGTKLVQGPGEMQFNAETCSHPRADDKRVGRISRTVGDEPNVELIIKLKPGAAAART